MIEQLWQQFADLGPLEGHAVATGDRDASEVAAEVGERLAAGSLG